MGGRRRGSSGCCAIRQRIAGLVLLAAASSAAAAAAAAAVPLSSPPLPPHPPAQRVDGLLRCSAERVLRPLSTEDVARMVSELYQEALLLGGAVVNDEATAAANATATPAPAPTPNPPPIRIRATHSRFHTPTTLACPGEGQPAQEPEAATKTTARVATASAEGADARSAVGTGFDADAGDGNTTTNPNPNPKQQQRISLLTDGLDAVLEVQPLPIGRMRVQAGMTVAQLLAAASAVGLSVPVGALPPFSGLTLGGLLTTAAHGTGPTTFADMVVEATWVDGRGQVHNATSLLGENEGRALVGGLGLTGIVTELLLQLTPPTLTHALVAQDLPDDDLYADVRDLLRSTPHVTVVWRPDLGRYSAWALYGETEKQAERRRRRERRERLDNLGGGGGGGSAQAVDKEAEEDEESEDARATAAPVVVASAPPAAAQSLLAWQRDVNLQGSVGQEVSACELVKGQALAEAPFAYRLESGLGLGASMARAAAAAAGWRRRGRRGGGGGGDERQTTTTKSPPLVSLLRIGRGHGGGKGAGDDQTGSGASAAASSATAGARVPATERFTAAFVGPTNAMAAAGCAPSLAAAAASSKKKGGAALPLCAWVAAPVVAAAASPAAAAATATAAPASIRASRGGSGFHLALDLSQLETWIDDARWALEADLQDDSAIPFGGKRCLPPGGIVLRFGAGLAGGDEEGDEGESKEEADASGNDDRDVRMDLAAPPDPAQLDDDAREEAAEEEAAAGGLLPMPPVLAVASGAGGAASNSSSSTPNATAPAVLEVDEASAAGFLSPVAGLKRPVYIQAVAATYEEEGGEREGGGEGGSTAATTTATTTKYGWVLDALERFTYCAYNTSAPHWGDSSERALLLAAGGGDAGCAGAGGGGGSGRLPGFRQQLDAQRRHDPLRLFEPDLFARVRREAAAAAAVEEERRRRQEAQEGEDTGEDGTAEAGGTGADGCAADGRCWCTEDRHCAAGFGCVESNAYSGVQVCKPWAVIAAADTGPADEEQGGEEEASR